MVWVMLCSVLESAADEGVSCKVIIYALAATVVGMAAYIVKQFADRISDLKAMRGHSESLENAVQNRRGGNP